LPNGFAKAIVTIHQRLVNVSLRFACHEARVGRYDALGADVFARLAPVLPPDAKDIRPRSTADPADEFR